MQLVKRKPALWSCLFQLTNKSEQRHKKNDALRLERDCKIASAACMSATELCAHRPETISGPATSALEDLLLIGRNMKPLTAPTNKMCIGVRRPSLLGMKISAIERSTTTMAGEPLSQWSSHQQSPSILNYHVLASKAKNCTNGKMGLFGYAMNKIHGFSRDNKSPSSELDFPEIYWDESDVLPGSDNGGTDLDCIGEVQSSSSEYSASEKDAVDRRDKGGDSLPLAPESSCYFSASISPRNRPDGMKQGAHSLLIRTMPPQPTRMVRNTCEIGTRAETVAFASPPHMVRSKALHCGLGDLRHAVLTSSLVERYGQPAIPSKH